MSAHFAKPYVQHCASWYAGVGHIKEFARRLKRLHVETGSSQEPGDCGENPTIVVNKKHAALGAFDLSRGVGHSSSPLSVGNRAWNVAPRPGLLTAQID